MKVSFKLFSMLKKEVLISKRNISIIILIILLPLVFGMLAGSFKTSIPKDTPVLIVPQNDNVSQDDLEYVEGWTSFFSDPVIGTSEKEGIRKLHREEVYLVFVVPTSVMQTMKSEGEFRIYVDNAMVPVEKISEYVVSNVELYFSTTSFEGSEITLRKINDHRTMPEYMLPGFIMLMVSLMALTILPYNMGSERNVIRRLKIEHVFGSMVAAKIVFFVLLVAVQLLLLRYFEIYILIEKSHIVPDTFIVVLLTMLYLSAISLSVTFITKFSNSGNLINTLHLFIILLFSGTFYPIGFFPTYLQKVSFSLPTYYSMVMLRGSMFRDAGLTVYADWIWGMIILVIVMLAVLAVAIKNFRSI
ncbi:MAG: ABC transporter permease [Methanosarcinaceae archaeon]